MRILLKKMTNERHVLEILRKDGSRESVELETKSFWLHDLVHMAVESEARIQNGFWGLLASGKTLSDMNDRTGKVLKGRAETLMAVEMLVSILTGSLSAAPQDAVAANVRAAFISAGRREGVPDWLTDEFVARARERLRRLVGHWNGTPFGETMEILWNE